MDTKTAYTRTFLMLKDQPLHEESIKTAYFTWWQNVRESYQARSLRLTKLGLEWINSLDIKTYVLLTLGCEWRWTNDKTTNWYPKAHLLRQTELSNWTTVISELKEILHNNHQKILL